MSDAFPGESLLEIFIFETLQSLQQLEDSILAGEQQQCFSSEDINLIFRIMHTIKGSAAVMGYTQISTLAHVMEDLFFYLRENPSVDYDCSELSDLILRGIDFNKLEIIKIKNGDHADGEASELIADFKSYLNLLKAGPEHTGSIGSAVEGEELILSAPEKASLSRYSAVLRFEKGCQMENIRAFTVIHLLQEAIPCTFSYLPGDIIDNPDSAEVICREGFIIILETDVSMDELYNFLLTAPYVSDVVLHNLEDSIGSESMNLADLPCLAESLELGTVGIGGKGAQSKSLHPDSVRVGQKADKEKAAGAVSQQTMINVNVSKMDKLMDLIGELVIAETMVTQNPDLSATGLELDNFYKAARQLRKITAEMQNIVMSLRMVPLASTFHKMGRIVRDMTRKLEKEAGLVIIGEETEVDKNIIEHLSDPLMHLVRNALDHGIESPEERLAAGKPSKGMITLEAKHSGGDVMVMIRDDGKGLHRDKILQRAEEHGLLTKEPHEMTDKEVFRLIFHPGFSMKDKITEFSGRGVGMDVVVKDLDQVGGTASVDSVLGAGSTITLRIPLTLAIIDGMNIGVGSSRYTLPTASITQSFRPAKGDVFIDPDGNELIMVRGQCYPVLRLQSLFGVKNACTEIDKGILVMVGDEGKNLCLFADELLGQQQVVVKAIPDYILSTARRKHFVGCTLLGDGSVSLILDVARLTSYSSATMNLHA